VEGRRDVLRRRREHQICRNSLAPKSTKYYDSQSPTSRNNSAQQQRRQHTEQALTRSDLCHPTLTSSRPRSRPCAPLPTLNFLLHINRETWIAQVRMVQRRNGPSVEESGLMSHLLQRVANASRCEMHRWYLIPQSLRRRRCGGGFAVGAFS
jgi:hypothetical protein